MDVLIFSSHVLLVPVGELEGLQARKADLGLGSQG